MRGGVAYSLICIFLFVDYAISFMSVRCRDDPKPVLFIFIALRPF